MRTLFRTFVFLAAVLVPAVSFAAQEQNPFDRLDTEAQEYFFRSGVLEVNETGETMLNDSITRAEFVRVVVDYVFPAEAINKFCLEDIDSEMRPGIDYTLLFADVSKDAPYALHLCKAMRSGMIWGYEDATFRPYQTINFAEAAKVLNHAFGWDYTMPDYSTTPWYESYIHTLRRHAVIPESIKSPADLMTATSTRDILEQVGRERSAMLQNGSAGPRAVSTLSVQAG